MSHSKVKCSETFLNSDALDLIIESWVSFFSINIFSTPKQDYRSHYLVNLLVWICLNPIFHLIAASYGIIIPKSQTYSRKDNLRDLLFYIQQIRII
jgi:hypothetical protein